MKALEKHVVYADDIAPILGMDPQAIRIIARDNPGWLGFPVIRRGEHGVAFPRIPFLRYMGVDVSG